MIARRLLLSLLCGILLGAVALNLLSAYASGVLFVSPTGNDANSCLTMINACRTIPVAVSKASPGDTIIIAAGTYTESVTLAKSLTLIGFGADATIIDQGQIYVSGATVNIYDLAMTRGNGGAGGDGGSLYNNSGSVTLGYAAILSSHAYYGGGLVNYHGSLIVDHTILRNNGAIRDGGGMLNDNGQLSISHSTIISNTACNTSCPFAANGSYRRQKPEFGFLSLGGGINTYLGSMSIEASAIISNSAESGGDGIYNGGPLVITNSTISSNGGFGNYGAGLWNLSPASLTNVTLSGNENAGIRSDGVTRLTNTIIANTFSGTNCMGSNIVSLGHNFSSDASCPLTATGDLTNTNPLLGPLQDNGGPTWTNALLPGSPAINHGTNTGCPATDQRGIPRPQAGLCDIGAYEYVFPYSLYLPFVMR